jgi:hypothetical protein
LREDLEDQSDSFMLLTIGDMKRGVPLPLFTLSILLGAGFLILVFIGSSRHRVDYSSPDNRSQGIPSRQSPAGPQAFGRRNQMEKTREEPCATIGVICASQYFNSWNWPPDGSCRTSMHDGYPEPDRRCTPGGIVPGLTAETLRAPTWRTKCIRNCQSSETQKHVAYEWYGLPRPESNFGATQLCELDHLVPLELGGSDGLGNIWPECGPDAVTLHERYFKQKDMVENYLAARVKAGEMPLDVAQRGIAADWVQYLEEAKRRCRGSRC